MTSSSSPIDISIVAPAYNEEAVLQMFVSRCAAAMSPLDMSWEIILVDDGSRDATFVLAQALSLQVPQLYVLRLSRNFGHQAATTAGLDFARGRAVVLLDCDLQDPPELIPEMVALWKQGHQVVFGKRRQREGESPFKRHTATLFYYLINLLSNYPIPREVGDFRLMDRVVVEALKSLRERHRFMRGLSAWVGYRQTELLYDRSCRQAGETKFSIPKMVLFAVDAITSFSVVPIRLIAIVGAFSMAVSILFSLLVVVIRLLYPHYFLPGFSVLVILLMFFGGLQMFSLGVVGEYVARIYEEVKKRPIYLLDCIASSGAVTREVTPPPGEPWSG